MTDFSCVVARDAEQDERSRANDGTDHRDDIKDCLLLPDRSRDDSLVSKRSLGKRSQDVEGCSETAEDNEERLVARSNIRDKHDRDFPDLVAAEAVVSPQTKKSDDRGGPRSES